MFKKILVANRGEIALRVIHTCREMGIFTVAIYSDADERALHVLAADQAVHIGVSEPSESYLNIEKIIRAARETGAEAVHPGYGVLAENGDFAERLAAEGIVFIGPSADVIRDLGDKIRSREIMARGGIPLTPGYAAPGTDAAAMARAAEEIGYPVMIKAAAGGGGKGIRVVDTPGELAEACAAASREAENAFGNGDIFLEKYFPRVRHIEFQILGDHFGNTVHLMERECSIQRRHQKIVEETPATVLTPELRERMGRAAVEAARAAGYTNAGTVEFLLAPDNSFYFLEINTRLQVEHPITEMVTGIDIVRRQLEIAANLPLPFAQEEIRAAGHAIECRVYAEDPENDFFPSPGVIQVLREPSGPGIRNDCGVYQGFEVPVDYDPILSKLVVHAEDRAKAIARMEKALADYVVLGVRTPIPFLLDILASRPFREGEVYTDFIPAHFSQWKGGAPEESQQEGRVSDEELAMMAYIIHDLEDGQKGAPAEKTATPTPWQTLGRWEIAG